MRKSSRAGGHEEGTAVVELAPVAVILIVFLVLLIVAQRVTSAALAIDDAARNAARQASIARTPQQAAAAADAAARAALSADHLGCTPVVTVDTAGFSAPPGQPASVSVTISCTVSLASLAGVPGVPGARTDTGAFSSPLDTFRQR
jgi:hypothetical protein